MQRITSTLYREHTFDGPVHCNCGTGETRRDEVDLPDRRVKLEIFERRTASFGTLEGFVTRAAEFRETSKAMITRTEGENACKAL